MEGRRRGAGGGAHTSGMGRELSGMMVVSCYIQSGVLIHALRPEPVVPNASPWNHHVRFKISIFLELALRVTTAESRLTVYCWMHIPAQGDMDPGRLAHFWNNWMHFQDLPGAGLEELIAATNGHGY